MSVITEQPQPNEQMLGPELSPVQLADEEEQKKKERQREDCCCDVGDSEGSDIYCLCFIINWCCQEIGNCTESCFDSCGDCIAECCNSNDNTSGSVDCCANCCSSNDNTSGCLDCCGDSGDCCND